MKILKEENFDRILIKTVEEYAVTKGCKFILVFDSSDNMGDKHSEGNLTVIYTPRDSFYKSADDKIVELINNTDEKEEISLVTDDLEIKDLAEKLKLDKGKKIFFVSTQEFIEKMSRAKEKLVDKADDLSEDDVSNINNELLRKWNK